MKELIDTFNNEQYPIFSINDIKLLMKSRGASIDYIHIMLHNLVKKQTIRRITRGIYTFHDDSVVTGFAFQPFYYGLESALWIHGISNQGANYTIITSRNMREGTRNFGGRNYNVKRISKNLLFGYNLMRYGKFWIPVSDPEKTVLDILYFHITIRDENFADIIRRLNKKRISEYLKKYNKRFIKRMAMEMEDIYMIKQQKM